MTKVQLGICTRQEYGLYFLPPTLRHYFLVLTSETINKFSFFFKVQSHWLLLVFAWNGARFEPHCYVVKDKTRSCFRDYLESLHRMFSVWRKAKIEKINLVCCCKNFKHLIMTIMTWWQVNCAAVERNIILKKWYNMAKIHFYFITEVHFRTYTLLLLLKQRSWASTVTSISAFTKSGRGNLHDFSDITLSRGAPLQIDPPSTHVNEPLVATAGHGGDLSGETAPAPPACAVPRQSTAAVSVLWCICPTQSASRSPQTAQDWGVTGKQNDAAVRREASRVSLAPTGWGPTRGNHVNWSFQWQPLGRQTLFYFPVGWHCLLRRSNRFIFLALQETSRSLSGNYNRRENCEFTVCAVVRAAFKCSTHD